MYTYIRENGNFSSSFSFLLIYSLCQKTKNSVKNQFILKVLNMSQINIINDLKNVGKICICSCHYFLLTS